MKEKLATLGLVVAPKTPAELAEIIQRKSALRGELIRAAKIESQ